MHIRAELIEEMLKTFLKQQVVILKMFVLSKSICNHIIVNLQLIIPPNLLCPNFCIEWLQRDAPLLCPCCLKDQRWFCSLLKFCRKHVHLGSIFPLLVSAMLHLLY